MHMRIHRQGRDKARPYEGNNVGAQFIAPSLPHLRYAFIIALLLTLLTMPGSHAQQQTATGLPMPTYSLAFDNVQRGTLYAGAADGVYKSSDSGSAWQRIGLAGSTVYAVLPDPRESNLLFAASTGGVFVSSDSGASWQPGLRLAPSLAAYALAADPNAKPATIIAAADGGVYVSHDRGGSWQLAGLGGQRPTSLAFDTAHGTAYAGDGFNLYRSDNGGAWQAVSGLLKATSATNGIAVNSLAVDSNAHVVYAATQRGLYKSADAGNTWLALGETTRCDFVALLIGASRTFYASFNGRFEVSADEGDSWNPVATAPAATVHAAALTPDGNTWLATSAGLLQKQGSALIPAISDNPPISSFAVGQVRPSGGQLEENDFAVAGGQLYRSRDGGQRWQAIAATLPAPVNSVLLTQGQLIVAAASGLYSSDDSGDTWHRSDTSTCGAFTSLALNPNQPTNLYAGCALGGIYISHDRGLTWQPLSGLGLPATPASVAVDSTAPNTLLALLPGYRQAPVYRSLDGGQHWRSASLDLPADITPVAFVIAPQPALAHLGLIAAEPSPSTLYLASADGRLFASADGGSHWQALKSAPTAGYSDLALTPGQSASLYLATSAGIYNSPDAGLTWRQVSNVPARQLAFTGAGADTRLIATTASAALLNLGEAVTAVPTVVAQQPHPSDPSPPMLGAVNFPTAGNPTAIYFLETHHNLQGDFLRFWQKYDGLRVFGYPLTEEFAENGLKVQYFERVRLEYHAENLDLSIEPVVISRLGSQLTSGRYFIPARFFAPDPSRIYFADTKHSIQHGFYTYWQQHGGLAVFGYPISEEIKEGSYLVQWFERARFEYRPEYAGTVNEVQETQLGRQILRARGWIGQG